MTASELLAENTEKEGGGKKGVGITDTTGGSQEKGIDLKEYEEKYSPLVNTALEIINTHPGISDDAERREIMRALITVKKEVGNALRDQTPEIAALREELRKKEKQAEKLQEVGQRMFLQFGAVPEQSRANISSQGGKPLMSFEEIGKMLRRLG